MQQLAAASNINNNKTNSIPAGVREGDGGGSSSAQVNSVIFQLVSDVYLDSDSLKIEDMKVTVDTTVEQLHDELKKDNFINHEGLAFLIKPDCLTKLLEAATMGHAMRMMSALTKFPAPTTTAASINNNNNNSDNIPFSGSCPDKFVIHVMTPSGNTTSITLPNNECRVDDIMNVLVDSQNIAVEHQILTFAGQRLQRGHKLAEYGINKECEGCIIHLTCTPDRPNVNHFSGPSFTLDGTPNQLAQTQSEFQKPSAKQNKTNPNPQAASKSSSRRSRARPSPSTA